MTYKAKDGDIGIFYTFRMDWINQIESRKTLVIGSILLVALSALTVTSLHSPIGFDSFWHLKMGIDWLENDMSPWVDHYSFTFNGHEIINPPVVFQGLLHLAASQFGVTTGLQVFRLVCFLLTLGAALLLLRQLKAPTMIYAIVIPMIVFLLQLRTLIRPEFLSYTFSIIALMLYFRAGSKISTRYLISMVTLMWIWSSYHSSVVGYVIFFGFFLECALAQFESKAPIAVWIKWLAWGVLLVAVGFLNPSLSHPLVEAITFPSEWKIFITEYLPPARSVKSIAGIYVLILIALSTAVMAYKQRRLGLLVIWAVLVFSAVTMKRMVTPSGIVVVMLAVHLLVSRDISDRFNFAGNKYWSCFVGYILLISVGVTLYSNIERAQFSFKENREVIGRYPVAMVDYMTERRMSGRILNDYGMGGYLIYRLSPQNQVYIDGRTQILYPIEHMKRHNKVLNSLSPEDVRAELNKYSINQIMWKYSQSRADLVDEIGDFGLDFLDARYVLYTRGTSNFPLLGKLMSRPECWHAEMMAELNAERRKMDNILPGYSALFPFADLVVGYSNAVDGKTYIDATIDGRTWFDEMRRFAGFRFLEAGHYDLVVSLLGGVEIQKPKDYLASALAMIKAGDYELASQIIEEFPNVHWIGLQSEDVFIYYKLYQLLEMKRNLTPVEQQRVEALRLQLVDLGHHDLDSDQVLDVNSFCSFSEGRSKKVRSN